MKNGLKQKAVTLRKTGMSYSEILNEIPVARSTLSLWLRSVSMGKKQRQRLTQKKYESIQKAIRAIRKKKLSLVQKIKIESSSDIKEITEKDLWLMGTMLYWAEGAKEKSDSKAHRIVFSNSDPVMIKFFLKWLYTVFKLKEEDITVQIYIHKNHQKRVKEVISFWARNTALSEEKFDKIYYKKHNFKTKRKNSGRKYYGLVRICVRKSGNLNRKIAGWIEAINNRIWGVV